MTERSTRVLVIGAGIGGLATGLALAQTGADVTIFERAGDLRMLEVGAGVTVWNNAVKVLDRLGVGDEVREKSTTFDGFEQRDHRGRLLASWPMTDIAQRLGTPAVGISRPVLHAILANACPQEVRTSAKAVGFEQTDSGVTVEFADGSTETGDVLIGADGIDSVIRAQLHGKEATRYSGLTMWRTIVKMDDADKPPVPFVNFNGPGTRFVWFGTGPGLVSVEAILATPAGGSDPKGQVKQAVLKHFGDLPDPCPALIEAANEDEIYRVDVVDRPPIDAWGTGRVTLLGDAAHPMVFAIGQGAAQALEDSVAIADAIGSAGGDVVGALRAYEARRIERAAHFQSTAWRLARLITWRRQPAVAAIHGFYKATGRIGAKVSEKDMVFEL